MMADSDVDGGSAPVCPRDGQSCPRRFPWLERIWADGSYSARQVDAVVAKVPPLRMEIVKRSDDVKGW